MKSTLKGMSEKELLKLRADVNKALDRIAKDKRDDALKAAAAAAKKFGYDLGELVGKTAAKAKSKPATRKSKAPAKFKNPDDPSQTWSGRGRQPGWYKDAVKNGVPEAKLLA
jgi:DNA-binding protein H-NS